ncbi:hypothetical protein [Marinicella litoralis]|uniref:Uncharacterized protein n=1 Tax=Marinicella litoralis TaxID=644220 RepID=A0A4R6XLI5_9GAMM|nr:hypothetical protein [Marinicella litoralis]TDR20482.1 hypothetical protein C8D91_1456 [Marinicella litoralis]
MTDPLEPPIKSASQTARTSPERLNFIIAVCAILISAASFYATYLQADAANKQVKAMTLPLIQYGHGNAMGDDEKVINFSLKNAGIGPALLRTVEFTYQGKTYDHIFQILNDCCKTVTDLYYTEEKHAANDLPQFITSPLVNTIIAGQDNHVFLKFKYHEKTKELWELLNEIRFDFEFSACYCSMLDQCYTVNEKAESQAVKACR